MGTLFAKQQYFNAGENQDLIQMVGQGGAVQAAVSYAGGVQAVPILLAVNGAINPHLAATYIITKAGVLADTLAAPTAITDDGVEIVVVSNTANAHTITATTLLQNGVTGGAKTTATFAAFPGASITLKAYNAFWFVVSANLVSVA